MQVVSKVATHTDDASALNAALFAGGIARDSLAGRLATLAVSEAVDGAFSMLRYELAARLEASESGLRYALLKLVSAGVAAAGKCRRGLVTFELTLGAKLHVPSERPVQRELPFAEEERRTGGEEERSQEGIAAVAVPVAAGQEDAAKALRECAALSRRVEEKRREAAAQADRAEKKELCSDAAKALTEADLRKLFPALMADKNEETARDVPFPIPHSPIPHSESVFTDTPSADVPGGNVKERAGARNGAPPGSQPPASSLPTQPRGGQIADLIRKIRAQVAITPGFEWVASSVALMAFEGPLSEHIVAECVAGCRGNGGKFVNAIKTHLAGVSDAVLDRHTLRDPDGAPQLHRFPYLRPRLAEHGIQLPDEATGLVRTKTKPPTRRRA